MKVGMNLLLWATHIRAVHFPLFTKLKEVGFDGVEIPIFDVGDPGHFTALRRTLRDHGLECTAVTILPEETCSAISPDPRHRQGAVDHLMRVIECANNLGAAVLAGPYFQVLGKFTGSRPTETELEHAAEVHRAVAPAAASAGMRCAVEPLNRFEAHLLNTMRQAADYVDRVDDPNFGAMHDTFHAHIEEKDPTASIETLFSTGKLYHVHISENDRGTPGRGHAKLRPAIRRLKELGYDGWLTIEAFDGSLSALAAATRVWRDLFTNPEEVYTEGYRLIRDAWEAD